MIALGAAGAAGVLGAMACWWYDPKALTFTRDVVINGHWVPRGAMVAWVLGATAASLAVAWWLTEVVRLRLRWLVVLGRTALALYVIHQLLVVNLVQRALGVRLADGENSGPPRPG
jgi:peptidoglycan/LPS O-acetylase OafA/YrhL